MTDKMRQLPDPAIYEEECRTTPWGKMVGEVLMRADRNAPMFGTVTDFMCGPGYLIGKLREQRPDLTLKGVDFDKRYIAYGGEIYSDVDFIHRDVLKWKGKAPNDVVICTGGLHHLPYDRQEEFLRDIVVPALKPDGLALIGDPYISDYSNEMERRLGAVELGQAFTSAAITGKALDSVIDASIDVMHNDIFGAEYKTSLKMMRPMLQRHFDIVDERFTWRPDPQRKYGNCLFVLRKK